MLEVGKLYSCSVYFLFLYPDRETADRARRRPSDAATALAAAAGGRPRGAAYWSRELGKPVSYCNPETPILVLSVNEKYHEVLAEDKRGWIIYQDWLNVKEIVDAAA